MTTFTTELGGIRLRNPLVAASGVFGYGEEYARLGDIRWFGAVTVKGTTLKPRAGNPPPHVSETPSGMLNAIGLENPGARVVAREKIPWLMQFGVPIIVNVSGDSYEELSELGAVFADVEGVSALEVNISRPSVAAGGLTFGMDARSAYRATLAVRKTWKGPLIVKLTPNSSDIVAIARAAVEGGADILSLIDALVGMAIDVKTRRPVLGNVTGGLSGPAIKPVALRCVYQVAQAIQAPIIGMGGVSSYRDVLEFMMAGASAVGIGSSLLVDPLFPRKIMEDLETYCREEGIRDLTSLVGAAWKG
ncbi:MAG: dihydroorotate dehydrogenase [Bacillota bacterium]|jgi:dihydroorotate dehydrogenase (NAD+) catalytic subunit|nr:dihydroorotate dehydrogenase [Candidatus Fermentithermobacillaceae bacterium]